MPGRNEGGARFVVGLSDRLRSDSAEVGGSGRARGGVPLVVHPTPQRAPVLRRASPRIRGSGPTTPPVPPGTPLPGVQPPHDQRIIAVTTDGPAPDGIESSSDHRPRDDRSTRETLTGEVPLNFLVSEIRGDIGPEVPSNFLVRLII